ncbi:uncharacterized protein LOC144924266 [Branchiostoma floridae x Branchiostoma belcheri]
MKKRAFDNSDAMELVAVSGVALSPVPEKASAESSRQGDHGSMKGPALSQEPRKVVHDSEQPTEAMPAKLQEFSFEEAEKSRPPVTSLANQRSGYMPASRMYWRLPSYRQAPGKDENKLTSASSSSSILSWLSELETAVGMSTSTTSVSHGEQGGMFPPGKTLGLQLPHVQDLGNSCEQHGTVGNNPGKWATVANSQREDRDHHKDSSFITHDNSYLSNTTPPLTHPAFQGKRGFDPWKRRIEFNRAHYPVSVRQTKSDLRQTVPQMQKQATTGKLSKVTSAPMVIKQMEPLPRDSTENLPVPNIVERDELEFLTPVETAEREDRQRYRSGRQAGNASPWMCEDCCERERKARKAGGCQSKQRGGRSSLHTAKIWIGRKMLPSSVPRCTVMNVVPFENRFLKK